MPPAFARILVLLLFFHSFVAATNFTQCLIDYQKDPNAHGGVDSHGHLVTDPTQAVGFTYETCTSRCGTGSEGFNWREFAQLFSSWLLPWLALLSHLPFGSGNYADDLLSVVMSVGSPALAVYSLILTCLNVGLVYERAKECRHDSRRKVVRALACLQQTSLELTTDERLLAFIPVNDHWRNEIADILDVDRLRNPWSVPAAASVAWVVVVYLFALVDSFVSLSTGEDPSEGQAIGTLWFWLLCLVVGWLRVPSFTGSELERVIRSANLRAEKKAAKRPKERTLTSTREVATTISKRVPTLKGSIQEDIEETGEGTDANPNLLSVPIHEGEHEHEHLGVTPHAASHSVQTAPCSVAQSSVRPENDSLFNYKDLGPLNSDERRYPVTFNYSRVIRYLVLVDDVLRALESLTREGEEKRRPESDATATQLVRNPTFPPGALGNMFGASIVALILHCGMTATAIGIAIFTPTFGLGCLSLGYIIYGALAIVILFLTVISTVFARISETRKERSTFTKNWTAFVAIASRRICILLALVNATGVILISCLQFSNFLNNCYCNASVLGDGTGSYVVISHVKWFAKMKTARIIAAFLVLGTLHFSGVFYEPMMARPVYTKDM